MAARVNANPRVREQEIAESRETFARRGCVERVVELAASGVLCGGFLGAVQAGWNEASHVGVARSTKWQVLASTSRNVAKMAAMMGLLAGTFGAAECASQTVRNNSHTSSWIDQSIGGAAAGLAVGAVTRSLSGGVGSAAALALLCGVFASMPLPTESEKKLNKAHD